MLCYRADPRKWCHTLNTVDILVFPQSPAVAAECRVSQRGTPHTAWSLIIQASGRVVADDSMAADGQMGGELSMRDPKSFSRPALREAAGK
jgi:hypothetical protein